ncbi:Ctnnbl1, partial [Symbiodinium sp. KB8]
MLCVPKPPCPQPPPQQVRLRPRLPLREATPGGRFRMAAESRGMKRAREVAAPDDDDEFAHLFKGAGGASESEQAPISAEARAAVAAAAEAAEDVPELDANQVKRMVAGLQKAVGLNTVQRAKWPDTPAKFMASELALHDAVEGLTMLGVEPTLYPVALDAGLVPCVGGLLAHPNTDIVGDALALLAELTDPEGVVEEEEEEGQLALVSALTGSDALGTVVAALGTVAPPGHADQGESTHASSALRLMDNILELAPEAAEALGQGTNVLVWLLACLTLGGSSSNTLHAAELLGSLLAHTPNAKWAGELDLVGAAGAAAFPRLQPGEGAVQGLLAVVAPHCVKRKDATALPDAQMEEIVANAFTALRSCVRVPDNADRFRRAEGIILMLRAAASATGIAPHAMQLLDFAVEGNSTSAMNFVSE